MVLVGRITGAHGIRGSLKIHSFAESDSVYRPGEGMRLALPDGTTRTLIVDWVRPHGRGLLMGLESITDRTGAEQLAGADLFVSRQSLPPLAADTYYWFELVGLTVYDTSGTRLGRLVSVIPTPGNDVYVVRGPDGPSPEILLPAIGDVILRVDLDQKTMIVDPPEGL
jgi:16S rRNA processing protein RimM